MSDDLTRVLREFAAHQRVRGFSDRTVARRNWSIEKWIEYLGEENCTAPGGAEVEGFLSRWRSAQSRYSVRSDLHQFYRFGIMRDRLTFDPTVKTESPRLPKRAPTPLSAYDLHRLIGGTTGDVRTMVLLGCYAGLRISEIAALRGEHVRLSERALVVRSGKGSVDRVVPLAPTLAVELASRGPGPMFPGLDGQAVGYRIRRAMRRLGISARPHDLRHSFGTEAARLADGNLVLVASLMGHSSVLTTQKYVAWSPAGASVVDGMFGPDSAA